MRTSPTIPLQICLVGVGPRGLAVLERLCAMLRHRAPSQAVTIHLVDPCLPGAGAVWRTDQSWHLLMNTVGLADHRVLRRVGDDDRTGRGGPVDAGLGALPGAARRGG